MNPSVEQINELIQQAKKETEQMFYDYQFYFDANASDDNQKGISISLDYIGIPDEFRHKGIFKEIMTRLCQIADNYSFYIKLTVRSTKPVDNRDHTKDNHDKYKFSTSEDDFLRTIYAKFGFEPTNHPRGMERKPIQK